MTFVQSHLAKKTLVQSDICPKQHLFKVTFVQIHLFKCDICSKNHLFKVTFVQIHLFKCDICSKTHLFKVTFFYDKCDHQLKLNRHIKEPHTKPSIILNKCNYEATKLSSIRKHIQDKHEQIN